MVQASIDQDDLGEVYTVDNQRSDVC